MSSTPSPAPPTPSDSPTAADRQATFCATVVDEWVRGGVRDAVVSPGSRSTPMALALAGDARMRLTVVLDERSASFRALGLSRATRRPTVLLCTSGTAAVEYHAAVVEADLDHVPLLVCTADRPPELHAIGAPQTVNQQSLFGVSVRWFGQLGVPGEANRGAWRSFASRALAETVGSPSGPGPVHVNLPFREPLVGVASALPSGRPGGDPWHRTVTGGSVAVASGRLELVRSLVHGRRGIIVAGAGTVSVGDLEGAEVIHRLASALGWPLLADPRSGLRTKATTLVSAADAVLRSPHAAEVLRPDVILRLGTPWASKVLGQWLAATGADDVLVDPFGAWLDPHRTASVVVSADPVEVARGLLDLRVEAARPSWTSQWRSVSAAADAVLADALDGSPRPPAADDSLSEPWIARTTLRRLPPRTRVVVSSSMPIRDVEWFAPPILDVEIHANRGANGIDGVVSTILGVAGVGDSHRTVGLLGDLAFLHDAGALASAGPRAATFVVVDNGGGGIFEFLPQATSLDRDRFELLFGTPQGVDVAAVARGYGLTVEEISDEASFVDAISRVDAVSSRAIVVRTDRQANVQVHERLNADVARAVEAVLPR